MCLLLTPVFTRLCLCRFKYYEMTDVVEESLIHQHMTYTYKEILRKKKISMWFCTRSVQCGAFCDILNVSDSLPGMYTTHPYSQKTRISLCRKCLDVSDLPGDGHSEAVNHVKMLFAKQQQSFAGVQALDASTTVHVLNLFIHRIKPLIHAHKHQQCHQN